MDTESEVRSEIIESKLPKTPEDGVRKIAKRRRQFNGRLHITSTIIVIMLSMLVMDGYLVQQNNGSRRTGVMVMLLIGDVCLLFVLRYIGIWVGAEVHTAQRGCSMAEWFLFVFVLDIKIYFVIEGIRKGCFDLIAGSTPSEAGDIVTVSPKMSGLEQQQDFYDRMIATCDYAIMTKKTLTLFQSIFVPGMYMLLVGADYLENLTDFRSLEEVKMRAFWVLVDLFDLLDLQATVWEAKQGEPPYLTVGFIYFYCYIVLIILPPLSLAEMSKRNELRPHAMIVYLIASFVTVNVATTIIRVVLLVSYGLGTVSAVFIGKNVICTSMKITKLIQIFLMKKNRLNFNPEIGECYPCGMCEYHRNLPSTSCHPPGSADGGPFKQEVAYPLFSDDDSIDGMTKQSDRNLQMVSHASDWKPSSSHFTNSKSQAEINTSRAVTELVTKLHRYSKQPSDPPTVHSSIDGVQSSPCGSQTGKQNFQNINAFNGDKSYRLESAERSSLLGNSGSASSFLGVAYSPFQYSEKKVRFRREKDALKKETNNFRLQDESLTFNERNSQTSVKSPTSSTPSFSTGTSESIVNGARELKDIDEVPLRVGSNSKALNGLYRLSEDVQNEETDDQPPFYTDTTSKISPTNNITSHDDLHQISRTPSEEQVLQVRSKTNSGHPRCSFIKPLSNGSVYVERVPNKCNHFRQGSRIRSCEVLDETAPYKSYSNCEHEGQNQSISSKSYTNATSSLTMPLPSRKKTNANGGMARKNQSIYKTTDPNPLDSDSEYTTV